MFILRPAFNHNNIAICFGIDENYLPYVEVTLRSLIENANKDYNYDICILHSNIKEEQHKDILALRDENVSIRFIDVNEFMAADKDKYYSRGYFTIAMYYRLFIPQLFSSYERVLYLDSDVIVLDDISKLYFKDLKGKALAAIQDIVMLLSLYRQKAEWEKSMVDSALRMGIKDLNNYFNSGVLIFDIKKALHFDVVRKSLEILKNYKPYFPDQDLLNAIFEGEVELLPLRYNFIYTLITDESIRRYLPKKILKQYYTASEKPSIIHYASINKPWNNRHIRYAHHWYKYGLQSSSYGEICCKNWHHNGKTLYDLAKEAKIVSFDIFDTLLVRTYAHHSGIFKHIEENKKIKGFATLRLQAEESAASVLQKSIFELNFNEIYEFIPQPLQYLKDIEKKLELQALYANKEILAIYNYLIKLGKRVILTSDMYHSSDFIKQILEKNGITNFEELFISNECSASKHNKTIYPLIASKLNVEAKQILHIGDNEYADFENAESSNFKAFLYKKPIKQFFENNPRFKHFYINSHKNISAEVIIGLCLKKWLNSAKYFGEYWEYFGYCYGGAFCYGISKFIYDKAIEEKFKEFVFVARDGYTIEKVFNLIQSAKHTNIKTAYICASRAINLAISLELDNNTPYSNTRNDLISIYRDRILDFKDISKNSNKTDKDKIIRQNLTDVKKFALQSKQNYKKYLMQFDLKEQRIAMFDGVTSQFSAQKLLERELQRQITGFYFLVTTNFSESGFFEYSQNKKSFNNHYICEFLIGAPELSTKGFDENLTPLHIANEYELHKIKIYKKVSIAEIEFAKDMIESFGEFLPNIEADIAIDLVNSLTDEPDEKDLFYFKNVYHAGDISHQDYRKILSKHLVYSNSRCHKIKSGAIQRVKNYLSYRLGSAILRAKNPIKALLLPFTLIYITLDYNKQRKIIKCVQSFDANFQDIKLEEYSDYEEALKTKEHLSYKLGNALIKNPLSFIFKAPSIVKKHKQGKK